MDSIDRIIGIPLRQPESQGQQPQRQQGGMPPVGMLSSFTGGGASGGSSGSAMAGAGPWAALAAIIAANEWQASEAGRRSENWESHLGQALSGQGMAKDMKYYGDKVGGFGGKTIEQMGIMGSPLDATKQLGEFTEKSFKNLFTPWKLFD